MKKHLFLLFLTLMSGYALAENWQYRLPDKTFVANLSIPGAHDAATGSGWGGGLFGAFGDSYARTQDLTIAQLWDCGVRAFDLRPCLYNGYMNLNHGIVPTAIRFEDTMFQLRDLLVQNPSEFIIIHLLHETDGDQVEDSYNDRIVAFLQSDEIKDYLVDYKRNLTVGEMRGKILILSRDKYATKPIGGFLLNWKVDNVNWAEQTAGKIQGAKSSIQGSLYMQDYADTHNEGGVQTKLDAIKKMLDYSTKHNATVASTIHWYFNFASAYSKVGTIPLIGTTVSLSDGYRDNASHTNAFITQYMKADDYKPGPTGIILMDYAGVDKSKGYDVCGLQLVQALIDNNFGYIEDVPVGIEEVERFHPSDPSSPRHSLYDLLGRPVEKTGHGIFIKNGRKVVR